MKAGYSWIFNEGSGALSNRNISSRDAGAMNTYANTNSQLLLKASDYNTIFGSSNTVTPLSITTAFLIKH